MHQLIKQYVDEYFRSLQKVSKKKNVFFENFPPEALLENTTTNVS